jgi:hypothetical protein
MVRRKAAEFKMTHSSPTTGEDSLRSRQEGAECVSLEGAGPTCSRAANGPPL